MASLVGFYSLTGLIPFFSKPTLIAFRKSTVRANTSRSELRSCVKVQVAVLGFLKVPGEIKRSRDLEEGGGPSS